MRCDIGITRMILLAASFFAALGFAGCRRAAPPGFDGEAAFGFLKEQCALGPRFPGSPGHAAVRRYLHETLAGFGATVSEQPFEAVLSTGDTLRLVNIVGAFRTDARKRILLGAHYDTRPRADRDPDPANRAKPILGANDGASGVAVLCEVARLLGASKPPVGVDIVFFDGEDYGEEGNVQDYLLGSRHVASSLAGHRPSAVIVIDMVGQHEARFPREGLSEAASPALNGRLYSIAQKLGIPNFVGTEGRSIIDDHLPFIQAGLPAIDIIDFDYPFWHTLEDTPDKCSPASLNAVGRVLMSFIWEER
jgi:glutaminyl-peptide cyclotransferase